MRQVSLGPLEFVGAAPRVYGMCRWLGHPEFDTGGTPCSFARSIPGGNGMGARQMRHPGVGHDGPSGDGVGHHGPGRHGVDYGDPYARRRVEMAGGGVLKLEGGARAVVEEGRTGHGSDHGGASVWCHIVELEQPCGACADPQFAIRRLKYELEKVRQAQE